MNIMETKRASDRSQSFAICQVKNDFDFSEIEADESLSITDHGMLNE